MVANSRFALMETSEKLLDFLVNFEFINCHQLNENARRNVLIHAQQIIRLIAQKALYQLSKNVGRKDEIRFVYPGNEIPDWINLQSTGSSISVELPHNLRDSKNFLGFVICAVVVVDDEVIDMPFRHLCCECHFESNDAARNLKLYEELVDSQVMASGAHFVLWYSSSLHQAIVNSFEEEYYYKKVTFCFFKFVHPYIHKKPRVVNCGVRLLYNGD